MRVYNYVGPEAIRATSSGKRSGSLIETVSDLRTWLAAADQESDQYTVVATFVVDAQGRLLLASRRSEHVSCGGGRAVLSAGEMSFSCGDPLEVVAVTNQSTGYCPEPESWRAVEAALDSVGVRRPDAFTTEIIFRKCQSCGQINIVKDEWFVCSVCDAELPTKWNFDMQDG